LTVPHLQVDTGIVIVDDFLKALQACPAVIPNFLPGVSSLDWLFKAECDFHSRPESPERTESQHSSPPAGGRQRVAHGQPEKTVDSKLGSHVLEVKESFIASLRRGQEHLDLSTRLGRAARIMNDQLATDAVSITPAHKREEPKTPGHRCPSSKFAAQALTRLQKSLCPHSKCSSRVVPAAAQRVLSAKAVGMESTSKNALERNADAAGNAMLAHSEEADAAELASLFVLGSPTADRRARTHYDIQEAAVKAELPESARVFKLSGDFSRRFRHAELDAKTERWYVDALKQLPQNLAYHCGICSMDHPLPPRKHDPSEHRALLDLQLRRR